MGQRNIPFTPMNDLEMDQLGPHHIHAGPSIMYGGNLSNYPQPNMHMILQDNNQAPLSYGMMNHQYNGVIQHHHLAGNLDSPVAAAPNHYNMYMAPPSGTRVFPVPLNHGPHDQFQFSHNHGLNEFSVDGYNNHFVDGVFKRKNAGNFPYCYATAGPSFGTPRPPPPPLESDLTLMDGGTSAVGITESSLPRNPGHMIQGNHLGQPFQIPPAPYLTWNQVPAVPYIHGSINGGCLETPNMNLQQGYQVTANNRSTTQYIRPPSIPQGPPNLHHTPPPPPMHAIRAHNIDFHPQVASSSASASSSSRRIATSLANMNTFQDGTVAAGPRFVGPVPPSGFRIYRPHRRDLMLEASPRQSNLPQLRVLPEDGIAILEFSGYHEGGEYTDHHRDLRLDIDHMSYEELLELGEHIGNVGTGLSEEIIVNHLKTKTFVLSMSHSHLEQTPCGAQERDFCVICQNEYKDQETIGILECDHEYHEECIKKWLIEKNTCPICKSRALNTVRKDSS